jgi:plasmid stabilization system protein ParE
LSGRPARSATCSGSGTTTNGSSPKAPPAARDRLRSAERLLLDNPHIGRPLHRPGIRRLTLARIPFFLVYRVTERQIEILRLIDGRAFDTLLDD